MPDCLRKTVAFTRSAVNLFFHILTRCNLKCRHCYINPAQHGTAMLPLETIRAWLSAFRAKAAATNLVLLGGEPTLHPDLAAVIRSARAMNFNSITVDTNGYLFHDFLDRIEPVELDYLSFSLDGSTPSVNDPLRGTGSHAACLAGIRRAVGRGFAASLIYTVSQANIDDLPHLAPRLVDLGVTRLFIQVIGIRGPSAETGTAPGQISCAQWQAVVPAAAMAAAGQGLVVTYPKVFLGADDPFACAGQVAENYFVFPNGRVYRCPLCEDYPLHSLQFEGNRLIRAAPINETDLFQLSIPEGCVMNRLIQPGNLRYGADGRPEYRIACCLLKEEVCAG